MRLNSAAILRALLLSFGGFACFSAAADPALASLKQCNNTSYVLETAIAYRASNRWKVEGWWTLQPGTCKTVIQENLKGEDYYTFARSIVGHLGDVKAWGGAYPFCTGDGTFSLTNKTDCETEELALHYFSRLATGGSKDWVNTFTEPSDFTASKARTAGIQRLLKDIGFNRVHIDGFMGKRTRMAISKFKKDNKLPAGDFLTPELFDGLARAANRQAEDMGLQLCNETPHKLFAAIAYPEGKKKWTSKGWYEIPEGECIKTLKDKLDQRYYYTYAEAELGPNEMMIWGGERAFCVNNIRFDIGEGIDCAAQGYDIRSFRRIDTEKRNTWKDFFTIENMTSAVGGPERILTPASQQD